MTTKPRTVDYVVSQWMAFPDACDWYDGGNGYRIARLVRASSAEEALASFGATPDGPRYIATKATLRPKVARMARRRDEGQL